MADLTFYTNPQSRGQIVRWMLEEVGEPYETVLLEYGSTMKEPEYLELNPMGKVPTLKHGDSVVTEAAAICAYLADAFPDAGLAPAPSERASYYRWLFFAAGPVEAAVTARAFGLEVPPERAASAGYGRYDDVIGTIERAVQKPGWLTGDRFTAADLYLGAQIDWGLLFKTMPARPALEAFAARLRERPAYRRAKAIDAELTAKAQPVTQS